MRANGRVRALSASCTHAGCTVSWNNADLDLGLSACGPRLNIFGHRDKSFMVRRPSLYRRSKIGKSQNEAAAEETPARPTELGHHSTGAEATMQREVRALTMPARKQQRLRVDDFRRRPLWILAAMSAIGTLRSCTAHVRFRSNAGQPNWGRTRSPYASSQLRAPSPE